MTGRGIFLRRCPVEATGPVAGGEKPVISAAGAGLVVEDVVGEPGDHSPKTSDLDAALDRWLAQAGRVRDATVFEEAAHWVAGWIQGLPVAGTSLSVVPDGFSWGRVSGAAASPAEFACYRSRVFAGLPLPADRQWLLEASVVVNFAGPLAAERARRERLAAPAPAPPASGSVQDRRETVDQLDVEDAARARGERPYRSDTDQVDALTEAATTSPGEARLYAGLLFHRAERLVESPAFWLATCQVAAALDQAGELSGADAAEVAEQALTPPPLPDCPAYEYDADTKQLRRL